jgi:hypothetical protein
VPPQFPFSDSFSSWSSLRFCGFVWIVTDLDVFLLLLSFCWFWRCCIQLLLRFRFWPSVVVVVRDLSGGFGGGLMGGFTRSGVGAVF